MWHTNFNKTKGLSYAQKLFIYHNIMICTLFLQSPHTTLAACRGLFFAAKNTAKKFLPRPKKSPNSHFAVL
jgi:hypothetical protein